MGLSMILYSVLQPLVPVSYTHLDVYKRQLHSYLDSTSWRFPRPNWKRIANARDLPEDLARSVAGKENDGHASIMLFMARLFFGGIVDQTWVTERIGPITDAAEWFCWQMDCPEESNFDKVLYSCLLYTSRCV